MRERRHLRANVILLTLGVATAVSVSGCGFLDSIYGAGNEAETTASPALPPEPTTPPLSFEGFEPGNIISDQEFFDTDAMTSDDVEAFIDTWNQGCRTGIDGTPCLADYTEDTPSFPADEHCTGDFAAVEGDSAGSIVWRAGQACGVNPQVLLVTLQKEQGLITASGARLTPSRYRSAMGYACPDSAACDDDFYGFATQVYYAARQMRVYEAYPERYLAAAQQSSAIKYAYPEECGAAEVFVENQATANLYNYTPYQPNEAALHGVRGECESPGNLNFYAYFNAWFGTTD